MNALKLVLRFLCGVGFFTLAFYGYRHWNFAALAFLFTVLGFIFLVWACE